MGTYPGDGCPPEGCKGGSSLLPLPEAADIEPDASTRATRASAAFTILGTPNACGSPAAWSCMHQC